MNNLFHSTTLRLTPAKALIELQHQANHYKNIINPRKISSQQTSRQHQRKKIYSSYLQSKFQKERRQSIQRQNQRIFKDCIQIYKTKGLLQKADQQFKSAEISPKKTLLNPFKQKQRLQKLKKQNKSFKQKINKLKPLVGEKQEWRRHEVFTNQLVNKLRNKKSSKVYNTQTIVKIALSSQKQKVNYFSLFKTLNFDKKQNQQKQQTKKREAKTVNEKRKKKRRNHKKQLKSQILNDQQIQQSKKGDTINSDKNQQDQQKLPIKQQISV